MCAQLFHSVWLDSITRFLLPSLFWLGLASGGKWERQIEAFHSYLSHFKTTNLLFSVFFHKYPFLLLSSSTFFLLNFTFLTWFSLLALSGGGSLLYIALPWYLIILYCPLTPAHNSAQTLFIKFPSWSKVILFSLSYHALVNMPQLKNNWKEDSWGNCT